MATVARSDGSPVAASRVAPSRVVRSLWFAAGWLAVAVGAVGVVLPVVPSTGPFILAATCFSRSSPRFEQWILDLPGVGPTVRDYRAGLGMPRRAKVVAVTMIVLACSLSAFLRLSSGPARGAVLALGGVGVAWIVWRVPTREKVRPTGDATAVPAGEDP